MLDMSLDLAQSIHNQKLTKYLYQILTSISFLWINLDFSSSKNLNQSLTKIFIAMKKKCPRISQLILNLIEILLSSQIYEI